MSDFHFIRPEWFLALIPLVVALWRLKIKRQQAGNWRSVCDPALLPYLLDGEPSKQTYHAWGWLAICGVLVIVALAGPAWTQLEQPVFREKSALVISLDLSRSMDAGDIKPSRLVRAQHKLLDILKQRREGETALLVYAAQPFVVTPLTDDSETIASQVTSLTTDIMPNQGSRPALAIAKSLALLKQAGKRRGDLLLITDGIATDSAEALADQLPAGVRLSVLAVATEAGAPISLPRGGFLKDSNGQIVVPRLARAELVTLSRLGRGQFAELTADDTDINQLLSPLKTVDQQETESVSGVLADRWREEGPWLLLLLLPLCALAFRRGYLGLVFVLLLPVSEESIALDWNSLWSRPDQKAAELLEQGAAEQAAETFEDPAWRAAAQYRAGNYQESEAQLKKLDTALAHYNRGNALARQGKYPEAVQAYQQALESNPEDEDAKYNQELLKKLLEQQQQQNQEQEKSQDQNSQEQSSKQEQQSSESDKEGQSGDAQSDPKESDQQDESSSKSASEGDEPKPPKPGKGEAGEDKEADATESKPKETQSVDEQEASGEKPEPETSAEQSEQDKAAEQWLKRIPDDPSGLLRRKFRYQYQQLKQRQREAQPW